MKSNRGLKPYTYNFYYIVIVISVADCCAHCIVVNICSFAIASACATYNFYSTITCTIVIILYQNG